MPIKFTFSVEKLTHIYVVEIVKLHGISASMVFDRFQIQFALEESTWNIWNEALNCILPIDSVIERTIHTLEDVLLLCVLDFKDNCEHLSVVDFSYNKSF